MKSHIHSKSKCPLETMKTIRFNPIPSFFGERGGLRVGKEKGLIFLSLFFVVLFQDFNQSMPYGGKNKTRNICETGAILIVFFWK